MVCNRQIDTKSSLLILFTSFSIIKLDSLKRQILNISVFCFYVGKNGSKLINGPCNGAKVKIPLINGSPYTQRIVRPGAGRKDTGGHHMSGLFLLMHSCIFSRNCMIIELSLNCHQSITIIHNTTTLLYFTSTFLILYDFYLYYFMPVSDTL